MAKKKSISAAEFDRRFESGEDVLEYVDTANATRRVNVDFPQWVVERLDEESRRQGITRTALIKTWVTAQIDALDARRGA